MSEEAPVPESKYTPFNLQEFKELEERLSKITTFLPESEMDYIWIQVSKLRGKHSGRPCSCKSSAKHWTAAIEDLRNFVKEKNSEK